MAIGVDELRVRFMHQPPDVAQGERMGKIRQACFALSLVIDDLCPDSREKSDSLTNLDYVMYQANAAVARRER